MLLQPVAIFLTSAFIAPNLSDQGTIDLKEGFFREARWLGVGLAAMMLTSVAKNILITGAMQAPDIVAHIIFGVLALAVIFIRSDMAQRIIAPAVLVMLLVYTGLLFADLGRFG